MRKSLTIVLCMCLVEGMAQEPENEVRSNIKQVTVFLEGAQVMRQANVLLRPGVTTLKLKGIAPSIQEQSIQVEAPDGVKILAVSFRVNYLDEVKKPERMSALETDRRRILGQLAFEKSQEEVFREEEVILKTNKSIGGQSKGVQIEELKIAMDYFRSRLADIKQQLLQVDRNIRRYNEDLGKVEAQLTELNNHRAEPTGEITVKVSTKVGALTDLSVKYLVKNARWFPTYDIRARNIQQPIQITYKANISQQSGEDWDNVEMTISSANPSQVGATPVIKPWYLGYNNAYASRGNAIVTQSTQPGHVNTNSFIRGQVVALEDGASMPGVNVLVKGTTVGTVTDAQGFYSITLPAGANDLVFSFIGYGTQEVAINSREVVDAQLSTDVKQLSEVVVTGYAMQEKRSLTGSVVMVYDDLSGSTPGLAYSAPRIKKTIVATPVIHQTNLEFKLDEPFSVKSDGEVRTTDMIEYELEALFEYYCAPKLDGDAFLMAKVLHWDDYNFLEGEASLFFEGKFIGRSILNARSASDTLALSLGRDGNVLVTREKIKAMSSRQMVGANQKVLMAYDISVRNKKAEPIKIIIEDQVPIPNDREIVVDRLELSKGEYNGDSGLVKWKKEILPAKTEKLQLRYSVKYPKSSQMILE